MLFRIEGGRIVLEMLDQRSGLGALVEDLRLAFIDAAAAAHRGVPWLEEIHGVPGLHSGCEVRGGGTGRHDSTCLPDRSGNLADDPREHNRARRFSPAG